MIDQARSADVLHPAILDVSEIIPVKPAKVGPEQVRFLMSIQAAPWPAGLHRHAFFTRERDAGKKYRAVAWNHFKQELRVLEISGEVDSNGSGLWHTWSLIETPDVLSDMRVAVFQDGVTDPSESAKKNVELHRALLQAVLFVTHDGNDGQEALVLNDAVLLSDKNMGASLRRVCVALGKDRRFQKTLKLLVHRFFFFGGTDDAFLLMHHRRGGRDAARTGKNSRKPGRLNAREIESANRASVDSRRTAERQRPVGQEDIERILQSLWKWYVEEKKSKKLTYWYMRKYHYEGKSDFEIPTFQTFLYHANNLIKKHKLEEARDGTTLHTIHRAARIGEATDPTGGTVEIIDVDGFAAKMYVQHPDKDHKAPVVVWVIFAVSRLSSAVVGYSLSLSRENARAYRECIASVHLPKSGPGSKAEALGLTDTRGLLHGNFDEVFVDNGPGRSKSVLQAVVDRMNLRASIPPPSRPELRAIGESLNRLMMEFMSRHKSGYTRRQDYRSKDKREKARKASPVILKEFERYLLEAVNHINLYYSKRKKRTAQMRAKGKGMTPKAIFEYTQSCRQGDAARPLSSMEVWSRYSEWVSRQCRRGKVKIAHLTYSSTDLEEYYEDMAPVVGEKNVFVDVQTVADPHKLLWLARDGNPRELVVTGESERKLYDGITRLEWDLVTGHETVMEEADARSGGQNAVRLDESIQVKGTQRAAAPKRDRSRMTQKQQATIEQAAANRTPGTAIKARRNPEPSKGPSDSPPRATSQEARPPPPRPTTAGMARSVVWDTDPAFEERLAAF
ncbi:hypothetical protein [Cupriavidus metallidurans]|uniref:hypothetical protein n=1 Tax=Cupriavidus metallidurans TaxID=119219 RepID=UPI001BFC03C4|nr:hypothetical protein [Cupriavidus metallidurans]QWC88824.1 hypothetical protein KB891_01045 [Cupriavidus metallidurans]